MWAILGLMLLDFLIGLVRSLVTKSFSLKMVLDYLKDVLYYVFPLLVVVTLMPLDPTGWILLIFYYIGGLAVIWNYLIEIKNKWRV
ncbi:hypothetical protein [Ectobacillus panaciterrae]|uniref:hypothetical protein n=1 Tax=Ectobacillus panaciterrae TaxID=363872 RepID=UPI001FDFD846|nr:hypothetical protein [Ectobacillus panaciterrae]